MKRKGKRKGSSSGRTGNEGNEERGVGRAPGDRLRAPGRVGGGLGHSAGDQCRREEHQESNRDRKARTRLGSGKARGLPSCNPRRAEGKVVWIKRFQLSGLDAHGARRASGGSTKLWDGEGRSAPRERTGVPALAAAGVWLGRVGVLSKGPRGTRLGEDRRSGHRALPVQPLPPSPSPRPPRMLSDRPSLYMKAVSSSAWPRSRKARTAAALAGESMRRPISMVPSTVAGRAGEPEAARGDRDMALAAAAVRAPGCWGLREQRAAARPTARVKVLSMRPAPARWGACGPAHPPLGRGPASPRPIRTPGSLVTPPGTAPAKSAAREAEPRSSGAGRGEAERGGASDQLTQAEAGGPRSRAVRTI